MDVSYDWEPYASWYVEHLAEGQSFDSSVLRAATKALVVWEDPDDRTVTDEHVSKAFDVLSAALRAGL